MEGVGQKRFSGVWTAFARGLYDWSFTYDKVGEQSLGETDTPKSAFDLEYELDKLLKEDVNDLNQFFRAVSSALTRVICILPRILMSDKPDIRYEQIVREYCADHLDVFLETWQTYQRRRGGKIGFGGTSLMGSGLVRAPYVPLVDTITQNPNL